MIRFNAQFYIPKTNVNFKRHTGHEESIVNGQRISLNNYTTFFRDYNTLEFTRDYIFKNYPHGANITEFGCSMGHKPYSLMVMLDKSNKDNKYKITGYDFPEIIRKANDYSIYGIARFIDGEQILFDDCKNPEILKKTNLTQEEISDIRKIFYKYFDICKVKDYSHREYCKLKQILANKEFADTSEIQEIKKKIFYDDTKYDNKMIVTPNKRAKELVTFKVGDIRNIDKILEPKKSSVIIFQNALYHILYGGKLSYELKQAYSNLQEIENVFKKVNFVLPQNGIFVIGTFPHDHMFNHYGEMLTRADSLNGENVRIFDFSPIHIALKNSGFETEFYDFSGYHSYNDGKKIYFPAVWKKVKEASL